MDEVLDRCIEAIKADDFDTSSTKDLYTTVFSKACFTVRDNGTMKKHVDKFAEFIGAALEFPMEQKNHMDDEPPRAGMINTIMWIVSVRETILGEDM